MPAAQPTGPLFENSGLGKFVPAQNWDFRGTTFSDDTHGLSDFKRKIKKSQLEMRKALEAHTLFIYSVYLLKPNMRFSTSIQVW